MNPETKIDEILDRYITSASKEEVESHCDHVFQQLQSKAHHVAPHARQERIADSAPMSFFAWQRIALASAVAAVILAVFIGTAIVRRQGGAFAVIESVDGSLYRVADGKAQAIPVGENLSTGETVRTNGGAGAMVTLEDGSRVEIRSQSELLLERAEDGVRIRLNNGGIIVSAAKQHAGRHLYVQTKDVTVSVVGTVFLVNAEEEGSRVAVIEGEVRVQRGTTAERLLPGDQVTTNPLMTSRPMSEEVSWSRRKEEHFALLQRSPIPASTTPGAEPREAFEVTSIRPGAPLLGAGPRGGGVTSSLAPCPGPNWFQMDPGRFVARRLSLYFLIAVAYGNRCPAPGTISGGPNWIESDKFDVEATIPEGTPAYTKDELLAGSAVKLQRMLQTLLAERFKLVLRREMKEMPVYDLVIVKDGKVPLAGEGPKVLGSGTPSYYLLANVTSASVARFSNNLQWDLGRPVLDKTGLKGLYDFPIVFPDIPVDSVDLVDRIREQLPSRLEQQLGLKLQPTRAPIEVLVIDRAEKPLEN